MADYQRHRRRRHYALLSVLVVAIIALSILATTLAMLSARPLTGLPALLGRLFRSSDLNHSHLLHRGIYNLQNADHRLTIDPPSGDLPAPGPINSTNIGHGPGGPLLDGPYTYYCGVFNTGIPSTIRSGAMSLRAVNITYTLQPGVCQRVYCYDTTAVYVCNNEDEDSPLAANVTMTGYDVGWMADRLSLLCCDSHHASSAQLFHPTAGWNTVVGYGNCRHDPAEPPSSFGVGNGGVNGFCIPAETRPSPGTGSGDAT